MIPAYAGMTARAREIENNSNFKINLRVAVMPAQAGI
jgi:hypothetical protein